MSKKFTVMHTGYPVAGRGIEDHEWKKLSEHDTESAAWKRVGREREHLDYGTWDDHYKVIDPDGESCDRRRFIDNEIVKSWKKHVRR